MSDYITRREADERERFARLSRDLPAKPPPGPPRRPFACNAPTDLRPNVRRAEMLSALVEGDNCDLRLVYRGAPMRVRIDRQTARELIAELTRFVGATP